MCVSSEKNDCYYFDTVPLQQNSRYGYGDYGEYLSPQYLYQKAAAIMFNDPVSVNPDFSHIGFDEFFSYPISFDYFNRKIPIVLRNA